LAWPCALGLGQQPILALTLFFNGLKFGKLRRPLVETRVFPVRILKLNLKVSFWIKRNHSFGEIGIFRILLLIFSDGSLVFFKFWGLFSALQTHELFLFLQKGSGETPFWETFLGLCPLFTRIPVEGGYHGYIKTLVAWEEPSW